MSRLCFFTPNLQITVPKVCLALGLLVASACALAPDAQAGPRICTPRTSEPVPDWVVRAFELPDGTNQPRDAYAPWVEQLRQNRLDLGAERISQSEAEARGGTRIVGAKRVPVFLSKFANTGDDPYPSSDLQTELFDGPWPTGTLTDYYQEVSYGNFTMTGRVFDWVTLAQNDTYYEGDSNGIPPGDEIAPVLNELIAETLAANDAAVDYGQFDNDGPDGMPNSGDDDGVVDLAAFVHPEVGGECGNSNVWSHRWVYSGWTGNNYETADPAFGGGNIQVNDYVIQPGLSCDGTTMIEIGVFCHEFGHTFGIPDLYDTTPAGGADSEGIGHWCLMAGGNWNLPTRPSHMSAWVKERLGWVNYFNVNQDLEQLCLPAVETSPVAVRLWSEGADSPEYFVVENRQPVGFDDNLEASGLVIYHIDETVYDAGINRNRVNANEERKAIDVECADATTAAHAVDADDLDTETNRADAGDVWCPSTQRTFDGASVPDSRSYSDAATGVAVRNINSCGPNICAEYEVGVALTADLCMIDCDGGDCAEITTCSWWWGSPSIWIDNDDDGIQDLPADLVNNHLWCRVQNVGPEALAGVTVDLYYGDPAMGQLWPSSGALIGTVEIPILDIGEKSEGFVEFVYPDPPEFVEHYCIGAIARHPQDPQNSEAAEFDDNVVQVNHQVLVDRAGTGSRPGEGRGASAAFAGCPGPYSQTSRIYLGEGYNPEQQAVVGKVLVGSPPDFSDAQIPTGWTLEILPHTGPFIIAPGDRDSIFVTLSAPSADDGDQALVPLTFWDVQNDRPIGGVILEYRIDCLDPQAPENASAEWLTLPPDDLGGPTAKLEWDPVTLDEAGRPEQIKLYEVYRAFDPDDAPAEPEMLVDRVAIDAEPDEAGFQWYDTVPVACDGVYTYRVRAIDGADSPGPYSDPYDLACAEALSVGDAASSARSTWSSAEPNPFNPATRILYRIPEAGPVEIQVFDSRGQRVRKILNESRGAGMHEAHWDGRNDEGRELASGVYFYRIAGPGLRDTRKIVLAR